MCPERPPTEESDSEATYSCQVGQYKDSTAKLPWILNASETCEVVTADLTRFGIVPSQGCTIAMTESPKTEATMEPCKLNTEPWLCQTSDLTTVLAQKKRK